MSRPTPKKSALTGSPIAPAPEDPTPAAAEEAAEKAAVDRIVDRMKDASAEKPPKIGFYIDAEMAARMRAAFLYTRPPQTEESYNSLSGFIAEAVETKVRQLEAKYNNGEPWPRADAGSVPPGRPTRV